MCEPFGRHRVRWSPLIPFEVLTTGNVWWSILSPRSGTHEPHQPIVSLTCCLWVTSCTDGSNFYKVMRPRVLSHQEVCPRMISLRIAVSSFQTSCSVRGDPNNCGITSGAYGSYYFPTCWIWGISKISILLGTGRVWCIDSAFVRSSSGRRHCTFQNMLCGSYFILAFWRPGWMRH